MPYALRSRARPAAGKGGGPRARRPRLLLAATLLAATLGGGGGASAAVQVGVYQDDPGKQLNPLLARVGIPKVLSTYVTGGQLVDPGVIAVAKRRKMRLLISWMPDAGAGGGKASPTLGLTGVNAGVYDTSLRALVAQVKTLRPRPILRPMPEMNTAWYLWSGARRPNSAAAYLKAWNRVWMVVRRASGGKVTLLWAPYHRSIPETPENAIAAYFPGVTKVDLVGVSGYNFGDRGGLAWTDPQSLFADAYRDIQALAPDRPFWVAETASTAEGGSKADWIAQLTGLPQAFPALQGVVWYDTKEPNGDFRLTDLPGTTSAFKAFMRGVR